MMSGQNNTIFVKAKNLPKDELAVAHKALFKKRAEGYNSFSQYTYSANYIHFFEGGSHIGAIEINGNEDLINDILNDRSNGRFDNVLKSIERYERRHSGNSTNSQEQRKTNRRTERIFSGEDKSQSTSDESRNTVQSNTNNEGLDLSGVQLMEGSDGTVYGWCEIERDAEGNVVARHIYMNDEVLNANTMVHEMGHLWLNLLSEVNHFNEIIMKVSKRCEEMIARYVELNGAKLVKSEDFANKILNGMEISQGKFDALVSYTYRVGENTAKNLIEKVAANPVGNFSSLFVKDIAMDSVRWGKEEVNLFENM
jgi:hypothetical protein